MDAARSRSYAAVPVEGEESWHPEHERESQSQDYLPRALRLPFLLGFISTLAGCIILIEVVLHNAQSPTDAGLQVASVSNVFAKRTSYETTKVKSTSSYIPSSVHCEYATSLDQSRLALSQVSQSLCSRYTSTYSAFATSFPASMRSPAAQWVLDINNVYKSEKNISITSNYCLPRPSTTHTEGDPTITYGCITTTVGCKCCCYNCAGAELTWNGSSITTKSSVWCAAVTSAMIVETSQSRTSPAVVTIVEAPISSPVAQIASAPTTPLAKSTSTTFSIKSTSSTSKPSSSIRLSTSVAIPISTVKTLSSQTTQTAWKSSQSNDLKSTSSAQISYTNAALLSSSTSVVARPYSSSTKPTVTTSSTRIQTRTTSTPPATLREASSDSDPTQSVSSVSTDMISSAQELITSSADSLTVVTSSIQLTSWIQTIGSDGVLTNATAVIVRPTIFTTPVTALSAAATSNTSSIATRPPQPVMELSTYEVVVSGQYNSAFYFSAMYLAPLLAILVKALWEVLYVAIRLIEPFERMSNPKGTSAKSSLFAEYLSGTLSMDVLRALWQGNIVPFVAGIAFTLIQIGTPIAAVAMTIKAGDVCLIDGATRRCDPRWIVDSALLRCVEAILAACIFGIAITATLLRRHHSGISSDPSSLASVATLLNHEQLTKDLRNIEPTSDFKFFKDSFESHTCWLRNHQDSQGLVHYGVVVSQTFDMTESDGPFTAQRRDYRAVKNPFKSSSQTESHKDDLSTLTTDTFGLLVPLTVLVLIITYWFDPHQDDIYNRFFNSMTVWPRFLLVSLATVSAFLLSSMERVVRTVEPFRRLAANSNQRLRPAPPETTLLIKRSGTKYSSLPKSIQLLITQEPRGGRMWFQTLVTSAAIFADLAILAVTGVPMTEAMVPKQYYISSYVSMALLGYVVLIWLIILLWWRNDATVKAVRSSHGAETIGGVMRYFALGGAASTREAARLCREREQPGSSQSVAKGWRGSRACFGFSTEGRDIGAQCLTFVSEHGQRQNMMERPRG